MGYSPQGHKESDTTEQLHTHAPEKLRVPLGQELSLCWQVKRPEAVGVLGTDSRGLGLEDGERKENCFLGTHVSPAHLLHPPAQQEVGCRLLEDRGYDLFIPVSPGSCTEQAFST